MGPGLFGKIITRYVPNDGMIHGYFTSLTPNHQQKDLAYVGPKGEIIALHKTSWLPQSSGRGLAVFGARGVNSYAQMWMARDVYA